MLLEVAYITDNIPEFNVFVENGFKNPKKITAAKNGSSEIWIAEDIQNGEEVEIIITLFTSKASYKDIAQWDIVFYYPEVLHSLDKDLRQRIEKFNKNTRFVNLVTIKEEVQKPKEISTYNLVGFSAEEVQEFADKLADSSEVELLFEGAAEDRRFFIYKNNGETAMNIFYDKEVLTESQLCGLFGETIFFRKAEDEEVPKRVEEAFFENHCSVFYVKEKTK